MSVDERWEGRLLEVGRALVAELDLETLLDRVLDTARELTAARFAAIGILNEERTELEQFLTSGVGAEAHRAIGSLPRGRGVLGLLIARPHPLRLSDVGEHPDSYGFPVGHPVMKSFLGVPITIRGEAWGNLYLTDKEGGDFGERDEQAAVILSAWAAVAIDNARLFEAGAARREELERAVRALRASHDITESIGAETSLERTLELIAKRGRVLVGARTLVIMLREGEELIVRAAAGHAREALGSRVAIGDSSSGHVLESGRPERIADVGARLRIAAEKFGVGSAKTALLVPLLQRGQALGLLAAFDHGEAAEVFSAEDEQVLRSFATSAATAVALAQSVREDRLRSSLEASEAERRRWARELHDQTLQSLGGLRVLLSGALRRGSEESALSGAMREAVGMLEEEIANLRGIISDLRPAVLDELGLAAALETLSERFRERTDLEVECEVAGATGQGRLGSDLDTSVYRIVQEALTNVVRHAEASHASVRVAEQGSELSIDVRDDGRGFDPAAASPGFGLAGMRERVALAGGRLELRSGEQGTHVRVSLPIPGSPAGAGARLVA